ncbi:MAG: glycosyltransferase family 2 protein, partial [Cytophagaceae bacterium]
MRLPRYRLHPVAPSVAGLPGPKALLRSCKLCRWLGAVAKPQQSATEISAARSKNLGFGKANNIGIKYALENGANYVFLLNQDAWVDSSVIKDLISIHHQNSEYGVLSPIHLNGRGTSLDTNFAVGCSPVTCPGFLSDLYTGNITSLYSIHFVMAAIWLIPREVFYKVGLFDPLFPHYGEDVDYLQRIRFFGFKIGICPHLRGYHDR